VTASARSDARDAARDVSLAQAARDADEAREELRATLDAFRPAYVPEREPKPRYHHIRFNDYERYETWHKPLAEQTAVSVTKLFESGLENGGVLSAYDDVAEFADDALVHVELVRRLRELRSLPLPAELLSAEEALRAAARQWQSAEDAAGPGGAGGDGVVPALEEASRAQAFGAAALLDMCPSLRGDAVAGLGPDLQWSAASLADLQTPGPLDLDAADADETLRRHGVSVSSVAEWRMALSGALAGMEKACTCALVQRARPATASGARAYDEHVSGANGPQSAAERSEHALRSGDVFSVGATDGQVAGPSGLGSMPAALAAMELEFDPTMRGDALSRKHEADVAGEIARAAQPWQSRKVAGKLSDDAPGHLRRAAEGLEKSPTLTAGQRARLLQEAANRMDEAKELSEREIGPKDLARMKDDWAAPDKTTRVKPWQLRFPVNTADPATGKPAPEGVFRGGKRPAEREAFLPDGAEHDAVHGPANPGAAEIEALHANEANAAALSSYHAFLARVAKRPQAAPRA